MATVPIITPADAAKVVSVTNDPDGLTLTSTYPPPPPVVTP